MMHSNNRRSDRGSNEARIERHQPAAQLHRWASLVIRPDVGDLLAVQAHDKFYYALLLSKIKLFGAGLVFAFHRTSAEPLTPHEVLELGAGGFHEFVDFIWAKRENRIRRLAPKLDVARFDTQHFFKNTPTLRGKADLWFIYDSSFNELRRATHLTKEEMTFPLMRRIDDTTMCELIDKKWTPDKDDRI